MDNVVCMEEYDYHYQANEVYQDKLYYILYSIHIYYMCKSSGNMEGMLAGA